MRRGNPAGIVFAGLVAAAIGGFVMIRGCSSSFPADPWPRRQAWEQEPKLSQNLHVNLFLDATKSMVGFLERGDGNRYLPLLDQIESLAGTGGWNQSQVTWWKFGAHVSKVPPEDRLLFQSPGFYSENTTHIDEVFAKSSPEDLTVVVTDLFQSRTDEGLLSKSLEEHYLAGLRKTANGEPGDVTSAVAVLGIETRFKGRISELGDSNGHERTVEHDSTLPFYLLILGPLADVQRYLNRIELRFPNLPASSRRVLLFTERPVQRLGTKAVLGPKHEGFSEEDNLTGGPPDARVIQIQVPASWSGKPDQPRHIDVSLDCDLISSGLDMNPSALQTDVKAESKGSDHKFQPDQRAVGALVVSSKRLEENKINLGLDLQRQQLPAGDYRFEVRVFPSESAYSVPKSMLNWDLNVTEVEKILAQDGFGPGKPGRTLNLWFFLQDVRDGTFLNKQPPMGIVYLYIRAN